jgi:hypothetical protein
MSCGIINIIKNPCILLLGYSSCFGKLGGLPPQASHQTSRLPAPGYCCEHCNVSCEYLQPHHDVTTCTGVQILRENKLSLKPQKCKFEKDEMKYLGMIIGHGKVRMNLVKVTAVEDWPALKNKKEIQQFLGFANYYRHFIKGFSGIAKQLTSLTGKEQWQWKLEQQVAFEEIKQRICSEPVLTIPVNNAPYKLEVDSSDYTTGGVLSQRIDDKWHPVAYMLKALNEIERNYEIYDKEMLAIMTALSEWRQYLMGASEEFEIWTDHQNLQYFRKPQKLNRRQARWVTELAEYHYSLHHKPGKSNVKPDILLRQPDLKRGGNNNEDIILLKM